MPLFSFDTKRVMTTQDLRALNRELKLIDDGLVKQMRKEAKSVGDEAARAIKEAIPSSSPFGRGASRGRFEWERQQVKGRTVGPKATQIRFKTSGSRRYEKTSLLSVRVLAPATVLADMAGKSGRYVDRGYKGSGFTRPYERDGVVMRHKLNGQGRKMIQHLNSEGSPSRFVWPAVDADRPRLVAKMQKIVDRYIQIANRRYN